MRETALSPSTPNESRDIEFSRERTKPLRLTPEVFEAVSKKTWVDVLMQILKVTSVKKNFFDQNILSQFVFRVLYWAVLHRDHTNN